MFKFLSLKHATNVCILVVSTIPCVTAYAQVAEPLITDISAGGRAVAIATQPANDNNIVVASESGGLFRTTNGGNNWQHVSGDLTFWFSDVEYHPTNERIVFATAYKDMRTISGGGIYRSVDGGATFRKMITGINCSMPEEAYCIAFEKGTSRVWVGTNCGLVYSDDNGSTWNLLPRGGFYMQQPVYAIQAPEPGQIKIISTGGKVLISEDRGVRWTSSSAGAPNAIVDDPLYNSFNQLAVSPYDSHHIFWSVFFREDRLGPDGSTRPRATVGILLSIDNGRSWSLIYRIPLGSFHRPHSVFTVRSYAGIENAYDLYFNDGGVIYRRTVQHGETPTFIDQWFTLPNIPHVENVDISFRSDGRTLNMIAGDGGVYKTTNNGQVWDEAGFNRGGYNALQIYQITGQQKETPNTSILYIGTQDNGLWVSNDNGVTWPDSPRVCCEGFDMQLLRHYQPGEVNVVTGRSCADCHHFITDSGFNNERGYRNCPDCLSEAPALMRVPKHYMQRSDQNMADGSRYFITRSVDAEWVPRFAIQPHEIPCSFPKISGRDNDPVVFIPTKSFDIGGTEQAELYRITGVMAEAGGGVMKSILHGYGKIGFIRYGFVQPRIYGVNPRNPSHLIIPDMESNKVRVTHDGGTTWQNDEILTSLVTDQGVFRFSDNGHSFITAIEFHPDNPDNIMVGTLQNGAFVSNDGGQHWRKIDNSTQIPLISSFYFQTQGVDISSFGRGIWRIQDINIGSVATHPTPTYDRLTPYYYHGCLVPLRDIVHPEELSRVRILTVRKGSINGYTTDALGNIKSINIDKGDVYAMKFTGEIDQGYSIKVTTNAPSNMPIEKDIASVMKKNEWVVKGLLVEGNKIKGPVLFGEDITSGFLPKQRPAGPFFILSLPQNTYGYQTTEDIGDVTLKGRGWDPQYPLKLLWDDQPFKEQVKSEFDGKGNLTLTLPLPPVYGNHRLTLTQKTAAGTLAFAVDIIPGGSDKKERLLQNGLRTFATDYSATSHFAKGACAVKSGQCHTVIHTNVL